ncbi:hypothetical protein ACFQ7N_39845 [Streptomyces niveus]|uniref:hypothetical protein n=1 Tax=Streptomyces niveus TaxID=193462 RepID=UPI0036D06D45
MASVNGVGRVSAGKDSVAAGGDVGAVITGDRNEITNVYLPPSAAQPRAAGPGTLTTRPIGQCHPLDLEVHDAIRLASQPDVLPVYIEREHDALLGSVVAAAASGRSQLCVLVGESSTGKTRACWEAIQQLEPEGWVLWHPFDPTHAEAALAGLAAVGPKTVVWLNEAQHYLRGEGTGERITAGIRTLLGDSDRAPVLVLGTLWPGHWEELTSPPGPRSDARAQTRELLTGRQLRVADAFTDKDLEAVRVAAATDARLAQALAGAADRRITQFLAGVPAMMERYENAGPGARAVLDAAMDARRLGCGIDLPHAFLEHAATDYLSPSAFDALEDNWFEKALAYTGRSVRGDIALLRRVRRRPGNARGDGPCSRLADYLEQEGRAERRALCPPSSFWESALRHLSQRSDLQALADAAAARWRLRHARALKSEAAARPWDEPVPHRTGGSYSTEWLYDSIEWEPDHLTCSALCDLAFAHAREAEYEEAAALAFRAAECCQPEALAEMALIHERAGLRVEASDLAHHAAKHGAPACLDQLAVMREEAGLLEEAEYYCGEAARYGSARSVAELALLREDRGDLERAEALWEMAAGHDHPEALANIARLRQMAGDLQTAAMTAREAVDRGDAAFWHHGLTPLWETLWPDGIEPDGTPSPPRKEPASAPLPGQKGTG